MSSQMAVLTCCTLDMCITYSKQGLVALLQPDIYVKGGDYADEQGDVPDASRLPETKVVQAYGGIVRLIPYLSHHSTTELIEAIKRLP